MTIEYPETCLKGIKTKEMLFGKTVRWVIFNPPDNSPVTDGWYESSVNWELDEGALPQLLSQPDPRNESNVHFKAGALRIPRAEIDRIIEDFEIADKLKYELKPILEPIEKRNKYHGNLLLHDSLHNGKGLVKQDKGQVLGAIARAGRCVLREGE
jgi:hypothetical protein